jgi:hypothetical protein
MELGKNDLFRIDGDTHNKRYGVDINKKLLNQRFESTLTKSENLIPL